MITKNDVLDIAGLARIHLKDHELERLTADLENILHYVDQLKALNVGAVDPTSHVLPLKNVYREDKINSSLSQNEALSITQEKHNGAFKVPQVIE